MQNNWVGINWVQSKDNLADRVFRRILEYEITPTPGIKDQKLKWENWEEKQEEWDASEKGRETHKRCKNVGLDRLPLTFTGVQLVTGHGNFGEYLNRFGLSSGGAVCRCGNIESMEP